MAGFLDFLQGDPNQPSNFLQNLQSPAGLAGLGILSNLGQDNVNPVGGIARGVLQGLSASSQIQQANAARQLRQAQFALQVQNAQRQQAEFEASQAQAQRQREAIESLPADQQALAELSPSGFVSAQLRQPSAPVQVFDPNSPTGTRLVTREEALGQPGKPPSSLDVEVGPDGTVTLRQGPTAGISKTTRSKVEGKALDATAALQRLNSINEAFEPRFLQAGAKIEAFIAGGKEKLGVQLTQDEEQFLTDFTTFGRRTIENLNTTLNELSGAAVTPQEFKRIQQSMPSAKDSPTEFKAKLDDVTRQMKRSLARLNYIRKQGLKLEDVSLGEMGAIIDNRGTELLRAVRKNRPNLPEDQAKQIVIQQLGNEFGIPFGGQ